MDHSRTAAARDLIGVRVLLLHNAVWRTPGPILFLEIAFGTLYTSGFGPADGVRHAWGIISKIVT
jgi:hypothetical protein